MDDFYNEKCRDYFETTVNVDPSSFLKPLLKWLWPGATVLDIGCGSGRDLLWLKKRGFRPDGLERASKLAELARKYSGCPVNEADFTTYDFSQKQYDALLLIGALVHLEPYKLKSVLSKFCKALKDKGHILLTLKEGSGIKHASDGRIFTLWQRSDLELLLKDLDFTILDFSRQTSAISQSETWLGFLLGKKKKAKL